jgi:hypothetical protein
MSYPPNWGAAKGDPGTATAALLGQEGRFLGYLNATPRQGAETLSDWSKFRVDHNSEEGDTSVVTLAAAQNLRFRTGRGSCVRDAYTTKTGAQYIEVACLVAGPRATTVIVGAAPPGQWTSVSPSIERAISAFTT